MDGPRNSFIAYSGGILGTYPQGVGDFGVRELVANLVAKRGSSASMIMTPKMYKVLQTSEAEFRQLFLINLSLDFFFNKNTDFSI